LRADIKMRKETVYRRFSRWLLGALVLALLGLAGQDATAATVIIANEDVSASVIAKRELQKIFLGRSTQFGGQKLVVVTLGKGSSHEAFTGDYLQMTPQQFTNHWRKIVFSGTGKEPRSFDSEAELAAFVARTPGAIGYVSTSVSKSGIKTLKVN
jgi:ABC-type phosphate transport system substrate-binding protein